MRLVPRLIILFAHKIVSEDLSISVFLDHAITVEDRVTWRVTVARHASVSVLAVMRAVVLDIMLESAALEVLLVADFHEIGLHFAIDVIAIAVKVPMSVDHAVIMIVGIRAREIRVE